MDLGSELLIRQKPPGASYAAQPIYIYIYNVYIYMYVYVCMSICIYVYVYLYILVPLPNNEYDVHQVFTLSR